MISKAGLSHLSKHLNQTSQIVLRTDFNVPLHNHEIKDHNRINATIPTIKELLKHNPKSLVMLSHLGRPNGHKVMKYSLAPIAHYLQSMLNRKVKFLNDCIGDDIVKQINNSKGQIFLCQNVRFHHQQEGSFKNQNGKKIHSSNSQVQAFRNQLTRLGNIYVNDAFGAAHRAHSSIVGINHKYRVAGLLMQKQLNFLGKFLENPKKPVLVILGGGKVQDKVQLIENMINIADQIIIGGGLRYPFLQKIYGYKLGKTIIHYPKDPNKIEQIMEKAKQKGVKIHFPIDNVCGEQMVAGVKTIYYTNQQGIPDNLQGFDQGQQSNKLFHEVVSRAQSIFWNGPMGVFEVPQFKNGSQSLLRSIIERTKNGGTSVIGGGDSANLVNMLNLSNQVSYVSTGGGATLQLMQGRKLPGVQNLNRISQLN